MDEKIKVIIYSVKDLAASTLMNAGATQQQDARDVGSGLLVAELVDPSGNRLGLRQSPK